MRIPKLLGHHFTTIHEEVINFLGLLVKEKVLSTEDVEFRIVDDIGSFKSYFYEANGRLKDWPYGFFFADRECNEVIKQARAVVGGT